MEKWQYYGLFLDEETKEKLRDFIRQSEWWYTFKRKEKEYLDHCTLLHISQSSTPSGHPQMCFLNSLIKKGFIKYKIRIDAIGISGKAMAFRVILYRKKKPRIYSYNENPHITICTFNGGKPVESNNITKWYPLDEPIEIETTLKRV